MFRTVFRAAAVALVFLVGFGLLLRLHLGHRLADDFILLLFDGGADFVALELHDRGAGLLEELLDRDVRVLDERLPYQRDFRQILAQPALHHFGDDLRRFLLGLGLLRQNLPLLAEHRGRDAVRIDIGGIRRRTGRRHALPPDTIAPPQRPRAAEASPI